MPEVLPVDIIGGGTFVFDLFGWLTFSLGPIVRIRHILGDLGFLKDHMGVIAYP